MISKTVSTLPIRFASQSAVFKAYRQRAFPTIMPIDLAIRLWDTGAVGALNLGAHKGMAETTISGICQWTKVGMAVL
jgi:hypothetical protein